MSTLAALVNGWRRIRIHRRLVLWLYLINVLFAAVLVLPLRKIVSEVGKTDLADGFVDGFSFGSALEFWAQQSLAFKSLTYTALGLGVVYLFLSVFLTGGIVSALAVGRRVSLRRFLNDSARYFGRYLRLLIFLLVSIGGVVAIYQTGLSGIVEDLKEAETTGRASFFWTCFSATAMAVPICLVLMVFDYAKIRTVVDRRRSMFVASVAALGFSLRRFYKTIPLFGLNLAILTLWFVTYLLVARQHSNSTVPSMVSLFVVQQIFIVGRIWMRLSFFSTQMAYYHSVREEPLASVREEPLALPAIEHMESEMSNGE